MTPDDIDIIIEGVAPVVVDLVKRHTAEAVAAIPRAADGKSVALDDVRPLVVEAVAKAVAELPVVDWSPLIERIDDAEKRIDGIRQAPDDLDARIAQAATKAATDAVGSLPVPRDGEPGQSITMDDVAPLLIAEIEKRMAALPVAKDGAPGPRGDSVTLADIEPLLAQGFADMAEVFVTGLHA